jgi:transcriptional regulator with XRE-family HTH domain
MTQEKLAEKADLHPVYISQVERADRAVTIDALLKITKALGNSPGRDSTYTLGLLFGRVYVQIQPPKLKVARTSLLPPH